MLLQCKRIFSVLLFLIATNLSQAQVLSTISKSLESTPKYFLTLASFNTFIDGSFASFDGAKTGLAFDKQVKLSVGFFQLANNGVVSTIDITEDPLKYTTNGQLEIYFFNLSGEYVFHNDYPWQFSVLPVDLAFGSSHYEYISRVQNKRVKSPSEFVILYQPAITAQYNIIRWFGFGVSSGYRFTILRSRKETKNLDGFNFSLDFRLSLDELYDELISSK